MDNDISAALFLPDLTPVGGGPQFLILICFSMALSLAGHGPLLFHSWYLLTALFYPMNAAHIVSAIHLLLNTWIVFLFSFFSVLLGHN